jgi:PAP2 superfamily
LLREAAAQLPWIASFVVDFFGEPALMSRVSRLIWAWIAGAAGVSLLGCLFSGISVIADEKLVVLVLVWCAALLGMGWCRRRPDLASLAAPLELLAQLIAVSLASLCLQYFAARTGRPLIDAHLAAIDRALQFNWPASFSWVLRHRTVLWILSMAYLSLGLQTALMCVLAWRDPDRAGRCLAANALALTCCLVVFAVWPAGGAFAFYRPPGIVSGYVAQFMSVRSAPLTSLAVGQMTGIIQFPSYHAAAGVLLIYAFVALPRWIAVPAVALDTVLVVSAIPIGGHHLADVIAGAALGIASLAIVNAYVSNSLHYPPPISVKPVHDTVWLLRARHRRAMRSAP